MKIRQFFYITMLGLFSASGYAYKIYNTLDYKVCVRDLNTGYRGYVSPGDFATCDPFRGECNGHLYLQVFKNRTMTGIKCIWKGAITGRGNYFIIRKNPNKKKHEPTCVMELHHD